MDIKQARKNVIEQQIRPWGGLNVRANQALSDIPRENFVPEEYLSLVFADIDPTGRWRKDVLTEDRR